MPLLGGAICIGAAIIPLFITGAVTDVVSEASLNLDEASGGGVSESQQSETLDVEPRLGLEQTNEEAVKLRYINESLELYDISARYMDSLIDGRVAGVLFKLRNNGQETLNRVKVTVYFKDEKGTVITEEDYTPVFVSEYSLSGNNKPLKPGYVWQIEKGKFYSAKSVPSEWKEGSISASITEIAFAE